MIMMKLEFTIHKMKSNLLGGDLGWISIVICVFSQGCIDF